MATVLNLYRLISSDDQQLFTDKANFNFDQILNMGGGPPGIQGIQGLQGVPGGQGLQGFTGDPGAPGAKWYVEGTDPATFGPTNPLPNEGDYWFDTVSLKIYKFIGSPAVWTYVNILTVAGIFKESLGDPNRIIFTNPTPLKSLVLSPVNYGVSAPQPGPYKLKIIGSPGVPLQNFGVLELGAENTASKQSYITVNTVTVGTEYSWELVNPTGDISFSGFGTSFDIIKQLSNVSKYEFNSNDFKIQLNPSMRLMSFYGTPSGLTWHVGGHNALSSTADRILSVYDGGNVGIGAAFDNAVTGDVTPYDYRFDQNNISLGINAGDAHAWARWRAKVSSTVVDQVGFRNIRNFYDNSATPWRSSEIRLEHKTDSTNNHFIAMGGGAASDSTSIGLFTTPTPARAALRFGLGGTANDGYYFAADSGPVPPGLAIPVGWPLSPLTRMWMGEPSYIKEKTGSAYGGAYGSKLNIQGLAPGAVMGSSGHTALHLNFGTGAADYSQVGITAGHRTSPEQSDSGILFQNLGSGAGQQNMMSVNLAPGDALSGGMRNSLSVWSNGESYFWSRSNGSTAMQIQAGGIYSGTQSSANLQLFPNDIFSINAFDTTAGAKSIVLNNGTNYSGYGDGFVGIGEAFSEIINAGPNLVPTKWYRGPVGGAPVHGAVGYKDLVVFRATTNSLTSGMVVESKPQTKFHVFGAVTFGTRATVLNYSSDVGQTSFTVGNSNRAIGVRSIVLGGVGHNALVNDAVIIGYNGTSGITNSTQNSVAIATNTSISKTAARFLRAYTIDGDITDKGNLLSLTTSTTGTNGIELEMAFPIAPVSVAAADIKAPLGSSIPFAITVKNQFAGPIYTYSSLFTMSSQANFSIGGTPYQMPVGVNVNSAIQSQSMYLGTRLVTGTAAAWSSIPDNLQWTYGTSDANGSISSAAISIRNSFGSIVLAPAVAVNLPTRNPRLAHANITVNAPIATSSRLTIFGGILHNKNTTNTIQTSAADIAIIGGEAYAPGVVGPLTGAGKLEGGDVYIAGGRSTYNNNGAVGTEGDVILAYDPEGSRIQGRVVVHNDIVTGLAATGGLATPSGWINITYNTAGAFTSGILFQGTPWNFQTNYPTPPFAAVNNRLSYKVLGRTVHLAFDIIAQPGITGPVVIGIKLPAHLTPNLQTVNFGGGTVQRNQNSLTNFHGYGPLHVYATTVVPADGYTFGPYLAYTGAALIIQDLSPNSGDDYGFPFRFKGYLTYELAYTAAPVPPDAGSSGGGGGSLSLAIGGGSGSLLAL